MESIGEERCLSTINHFKQVIAKITMVVHIVTIINTKAYSITVMAIPRYSLVAVNRS